MGIVRPVMEQFPFAWALFVPFILVTSFTVLNLFIGVMGRALYDLDGSGVDTTIENDNSSGMIQGRWTSEGTAFEDATTRSLFDTTNARTDIGDSNTNSPNDNNINCKRGAHSDILINTHVIYGFSLLLLLILFFCCCCLCCL